MQSFALKFIRLLSQPQNRPKGLIRKIATRPLGNGARQIFKLPIRPFGLKPQLESNTSTSTPLDLSLQQQQVHLYRSFCQWRNHCISKFSTILFQHLISKVVCQTRWNEDDFFFFFDSRNDDEMEHCPPFLNMYRLSTTIGHKIWSFYGCYLNL